MDRIQSFLASLFEFEQRNNVRFTPNEKMQMINIVPIQPVDVHIVWYCISCNMKIVEECPERLTDDLVDELISIVTRTLLYPRFLNKHLLTCHSISPSIGRTGRKKSRQTRWPHSEWTHSRNAKRREAAHHSTMKHSYHPYASNSVPLFRHCCGCLIARIHRHKELYVLCNEKRITRLPGRVSRKEREERDNRALRSDCSNYVRGDAINLPRRNPAHP